MYEWIEKGKRGGQSVISKRYCKSNNYYNNSNLTKNSHDQEYIFYIDYNNLYGSALYAYLPVKNFKWVTKESLKFFDLSEFTETSEQGCILECSLTYPKEIMDRDNDFPLAPSKLAVAKNDLSPYQKELLAKSEVNYNEKIEKLVGHFHPRKNYIVHYQNLQYYLSKGLKLTKIHRVLTFDQSPFLKEFIMFNTRRRMCAKTNFEKDFYKLINNSAFGRSCMNKRNRVNVKIVKTKKMARILVKKTILDFSTGLQRDYTHLR